MTTSINHLVCGDPETGHREGCPLDTAEAIAAEAIAVAQQTGGNPFVAAVATLHEAGVLLDVPAGFDPLDYLLGLLDDLWSAGLLRGAEVPDAQS